ncbi:MAG: hypothetical protein AB9917_11830 [Negativicutes bacterium]
MMEVYVLGDLKKRVLAGLLLMMIMMALPSIGMAGKQDFTLVNNSPYAIVGLWVAPADSDNWEENILAGESLGKNESIDITFDNSNNVTWWNFRIKDSSGKVWTWTKKKYNLTVISELTYYYNNVGGAIKYK